MRHIYAVMDHEIKGAMDGGAVGGQTHSDRSDGGDFPAGLLSASHAQNPGNAVKHVVRYM